MSVRRKAIAAAAGAMPPPLMQLPVTQHADQPPPSSVAVIVKNLKTVDGSARLVDRDVFQQLLAEVLGTDGGDPTDTAGFEDNVGVNYKVVEVVMDAGLSILLQDDPFASSDELLLQASNSLLVVRLTIQRSPQVLFCPPPVESGAETNRPVLFLWLLPRLFPLLGHKATGTLVQDLLETIEALFVAAARIPEAWKYLKVVMGYCQSCVNCTLFVWHLWSIMIVRMCSKTIADSAVCLILSRRYHRFVPKQFENHCCYGKIFQTGASGRRFLSQSIATP